MAKCHYLYCKMCQNIWPNKKAAKKVTFHLTKDIFTCSQPVVVIVMRNDLVDTNTTLLADCSIQIIKLLTD